MPRCSGRITCLVWQARSHHVLQRSLLTTDDALGVHGPVSALAQTYMLACPAAPAPTYCLL
jgi:hypothetical protein